MTTQMKVEIFFFFDKDINVECMKNHLMCGYKERTYKKIK